MAPTLASLGHGTIRQNGRQGHCWPHTGHGRKLVRQIIRGERTDVFWARLRGE